MRTANFYGRNGTQYGAALKQLEQINAPEEEKKEQPRVHMFQVGKARKDEPKLDQPLAAKIGVVPELNFRLLLTGPSNSGKTNFGRWVIDKYYQGSFNRTLLMSPTAKIDPVWKDLKGLKKADRIEKLSIKPLKKLLQEQKAKVKSMGKAKASKALLILDDTIGNTQFINSPEFLQIFIRGRHFNISSIVMTQSYVKLPRSVRLQATHAVMFPSFRSEIERLYEDHGPYQLSKNEWFSMVMQACEKTDQEQWPFFYLDTTKPVEERYRRCLYEILPIPSHPSREATTEQTKRGKRKGRKKKTEDEEEQRDSRFNSDPPNTTAAQRTTGFPGR